MQRKDNCTVQSVDKALRILELLEESPDGLILTDISRMLQVPKSTTFKILTTLLSRGYLCRADGSRRYSLGIRLFELGHQALGHVKEREGIHLLLQELSSKFNETAHFSVLRGSDVLYLDKVESRASLRMVTAVGTRRPAHCTATGKALLAWLTEPDIRSIMSGEMTAFTPRTITDVERLLEDLACVRERGYAIDYEENEPGIVCIGAPVTSPDGNVVAAISVSGPTVRIGMEEVPIVAEAVVDTARRVSRSYGHCLTAYAVSDRAIRASVRPVARCCDKKDGR